MVKLWLRWTSKFATKNPQLSTKLCQSNCLHTLPLNLLTRLTSDVRICRDWWHTDTWLVAALAHSCSTSKLEWWLQVILAFHLTQLVGAYQYCIKLRRKITPRSTVPLHPMWTNLNIDSSQHHVRLSGGYLCYASSCWIRSVIGRTLPSAADILDWWGEYTATL